jgi:predicted  nucleic acid-binding Zn-ribbon protein
MSKIPKPLVKQIENFNEIIEALNGLVDDKIKLEHYDDTFVEILTDIRKKGLELKDEIEVFKNKLEASVIEEYDVTSSSRFAAVKGSSKESTKRVIDSFLTSNGQYRL